MSSEEAVREVAGRARTASHELATATRATKDAALLAMAGALVASSTEILAANAEDVARAEAAGTPANIVDRLRLDESRLEAMAQGLRDVAGLPDPVGEVLRGSTLANGLELRQVRVPFGVVGMIYEARPNVTADAAGICLKSGNAVLLRGSSSARSSNAAIVEAMRGAVARSGLPEDVVQLVPGDTHDSVKALMRARGLVDVLIPRGGAGLIRSVVEESTVPVIETGVLEALDPGWLVDALDLALSPISPVGRLAFRIGDEEASLVDGVARPGLVDDPDVFVESDAIGFYHLVVNRQTDGVRIEGDFGVLERLIDAFGPKPAMPEPLLA